MYGARPIRRWVQKNVITILSEMLIKGEVNEGSAIFIDATDDKKALKYDVTKMAVLPPQEEMHASESDSECDEEVVPPPKEMKVLPPPKEVKHIQESDIESALMRRVSRIEAHEYRGPWYDRLRSPQSFLIAIAVMSFACFKKQG